MFESRQRLDLFQKLIHCSLGISQWTYNVKGELLSSSPDAAEENNCFFALENSYEDALQAGAVQDYPLLITNSLNLMWIAAYEKEDGPAHLHPCHRARICRYGSPQESGAAAFRGFTCRSV